VAPVPSGYADLIDCGPDFVCDKMVDPMIARYEFSDTSVTFTNETAPTFMIDLTSTVDVYDYKRYEITFVAGSFKDSANNLAAETVLEFLKDPSGAFDMKNVLAPSSSTVEELTYDLELIAEPGTYSLCYCDAQMDETLFDAGDGKTTVKPAFGQKATASTAWPDTTAVGSRLLSEHICSTKCAAGCVGDDCFCSGYDTAEGNMMEVYCLSPPLCRSVCDELGAACAGFGTKGTDSCVLYEPSFSLDPAGKWTSYTKEMGTACTDPDEFTTLVGKATVTARADVYVEYVVEPGVTTTLEIAGTGMLEEKAGMMLSSDRIMVVDCDGMCGYSAPSQSVVTEGVPGWNELAPYAWGKDNPHEDDQNPYVPSWEPASWKAHDGAMGNYMQVDGLFCPDNIIIKDLPEMPMEGHMRPPSVHLCYDKCIAQDCEGDDCFCDGAFTGYDTETSNALCADEDLCKHLCDTYEECKSIDMDMELPRCFLNFESCDASSGVEPEDVPYYNLLIKVTDQNGFRKLRDNGPTSAKPSLIPQKEAPFRKLKSAKAAPPADKRSLLPAIASGYSHEKLLIFQDIKFTSGGTFKVCFCDATLLGDGEVCDDPSDYGVEVGEVQASGISCLLTNSMFNRKTCVGMGDAGALRCYSGTPPDTEPPMYPDVAPDTPVPGGDGPGEPVASTYCRLHPELCR